jgi:hypothetical protein
MQAGGIAMARRPDAAPGSLGGAFRGAPPGIRPGSCTGALSPVPPETETVVSKGPPT